MTNIAGSEQKAPTKAGIETAVINALSRTLRIPRGEIRLTSRLYEDLGLDSLGLIHVNIAVEEQLGGAISIGEAPEDELRIVEDVVNFVVARLALRDQEVRS